MPRVPQRLRVPLFLEFLNERAPLQHFLRNAHRHVPEQPELPQRADSVAKSHAQSKAHQNVYLFRHFITRNLRVFSLF